MDEAEMLAFIEAAWAKGGLPDTAYYNGPEEDLPEFLELVGGHIITENNDG